MESIKLKSYLTAIPKQIRRVIGGTTLVPRFEQTVLRFRGVPAFSSDLYLYLLISSILVLVNRNLRKAMILTRKWEGLAAIALKILILDFLPII